MLVSFHETDHNQPTVISLRALLWLIS